MYGSDFPYCTTEAQYNTSKLEEYEMSDELQGLIDRDVAVKLFPRLK